MLVAAAILGFIFGFVGSIPIAGPVAALVFRRALEGRARSALHLAVGAALAESIYVYLAFWGLSELLERHAWIDAISRIVAAMLLIALGLRLALAPRTEPIPTVGEPAVRDARSFLLGLTVTMMNPALIAIWTAAVAALYSVDFLHFDARAALPFSAGAGAGIVAWFAALLTMLRRLRMGSSRKTIDRSIRAVGILLAIIGLGLAVYLAGCAESDERNDGAGWCRKAGDRCIRVVSTRMNEPAC
jgi:threonine/homoserine/homoserine lactone efflux protein